MGENIELLSRIKLGDEKYFEVIFKKFYIGLCYFAFDYVQSKENAEDIVSGVFHKLWENRENLDKNLLIKSYLYKTIQNQCINYLRHKSVKEKYKQTITNEFKMNNDLEQIGNDDIHSNIVALELQNKINEAINSLPKQCREIFELNRFKKLKYKEIAELLNLSVKTVETQMYRALIKLREQLKEYL
ncbi:MAG: RNA polymerase sigma-70 factor [Bacteroidales bacterium]|nr:RNA polymerase sigma-70 factor [Bacteroidales bacterium]